MYTEKERAKLLIQAATAVSTYPEVEGIVQVGSGVDGFGDQYSDIDLIFSTFSADQLASLRTRVERMFSDAVYIRPKPLPAGVFLYVFLKNGLEFDIVLLPTRALQVRSSHWKILTDKTGQVLQRMHSSQLEEMDQQTFRGTLVEWEFEIIYALRGILFEIQRENFLYVLSRMEFVRDKLVRLQCYYEKKETHQFKDYRTLDEDFQLRLRGDLSAGACPPADAQLHPAAIAAVFKAAQRQSGLGDRQQDAGHPQSLGPEKGRERVRKMFLQVEQQDLAQEVATVSGQFRQNLEELVEGISRTAATFCGACF